jgi:drug/metabolite transporter (DMT)-like permease
MRPAERTGIALAFGTALISGLAVYLNSFAVKQVPDAAVFTTAKNGVAAVVLVALAVAAGGRTTVRTLDRRGWAGLLALGVIGGSVPFLLFFTGLAQASAPSAAFIHKTLFVWVALLAVPLLGERLGWIQVGALATLLAGQAIVAPPRDVAWGTGETLIAAATLLWSVEVIVAKRLLGTVPAAVGAAGRMGIGLVLLLGYLAVSGKLGDLLALTPAAWGWVLLTGLLLAGYVSTWYAALRRAPATVVTSVLVVGAVITAALQSVQKGALPEPSAIGGYVLIAAGAVAVAVLASRRHAAVVESAA